MNQVPLGIEESHLAIDNQASTNSCAMKIWQWLYKTQNSPLWEMTPMYLTKGDMEKFVEKYNADIITNPIVDYGKAKITKLLRSTEEKNCL